MVCREALKMKSVEKLLKLLRLGISGKMFNFIKAFLTNRRPTAQVRIDSSYSQSKDLENGLPQGSVLSPILFSIMVNDLQCVFHLSCCIVRRFGQVGTDISQLNDMVQENLNRVYAWCSKWGFRVSESKSTAVLFTRKRNVPDISLKFDNKVIPLKSEFKYIGLFFQTNGTYSKHTSYMIDKCQKRLNLLRAVKGSSR